jgi:hypothetical protein
MSGLFLCAESDEAFFRPTIFQLGSDPVKATGHATTIVCVFVAVESFKYERPLIRAEVNGLGGRWISHEWAACSFREWSVL